jgi:streptogramin lyase
LLHRFHDDEWSEIAGSSQHFGDSDGASGDARLRPADGIALDGERLVFTDSANHKLRQLDLRSGYVTTIAGSGVSAHDLQMPRGVLVTPDAYIVADTGNHRIVRIARAH